MENREIVYIVSDSVGETAELVVKAVATQFNRGYVEIKRQTYVESFEDIEDVLAMAIHGSAIIAYTIVIPTLKEYLDKRAKDIGIHAVDLLNPLMEAFINKFNQQPKYQPKLMRKLDDDYFRKIEAIEFAVKYDDGRDPRGILNADIILIGVSRTSKTPLSMYLAHKRYKVANVPIVPEINPPEELFKMPRNKCVGLIISPDKLNAIRKERLKNLGLKSEANYASFERILEELDYAEKIMKRIGCPIINVSDKAIEETVDYILDILKKERSS
ncbi:pyruvate, water dikinase regulatory protein [Schinkia azotoformans]|uniref:pyruvate, water dikinase regulatory protein n=1 Tax=Schinkia azotoformans TaxID=1454 RepID=UPI002DBA4BC3|nr:pyruvate, water dikinase regulatory protein [Schinkia azotoformans]MEC1743235.1 kinase/pyrophosphorylase [Schinkia azotoformans]MEC1767053.1 kinase/pyrophosphorylase [Schinkia azotoformans]MEC1786681.1 kinase/pyrophosphorylase [Schinkia azotoformans]MED4374275.1 kinase/pyrophosphorylase [Schinkia azotoformans]MED4417489.1 kinase/pyrophosphorylase [Schinkia azotoformans]